MKKFLLMMGLVILVFSGCTSGADDDNFVFAIADELPGIDHAQGASKSSFQLFSDVYATLKEVDAS